MNNNKGIVFDVGKAHDVLILFRGGVVGGGRGTLCVLGCEDRNLK